MSYTVQDLIDKLQKYDDKSTPMLAILWHEEDFQGVQSDMTKEQIIEAMGVVDKDYDAEIGVNWDTIGVAIDQVMGGDDED